MVSVTAATLVAFAAGAIGAPQALIDRRQAPGGCNSTVELDASTNVWQNYKLHANSFYRSEVEAAAAEMSGDAAEAALRVADIGTFLWADTIANIARIEPALQGVPCDEIFGLVVYDLPGRDCAAKASNGELKVGEIDRYKTEFIDVIADIIKAYPNQAFALVIEPDSLPNLVTNIDLQSCQDSAAGYREGVAYALKTLNLPNVVTYIDAGHGGWLGWDENLTPGAQELADVYIAAGSPSQVRGIATNVAGWNQWDMVPGEFADDPDAQYNQAQNEKLFLELFSPELEAAGMPGHAIVDTGRSGNPGGRLEWGDWCNVVDAGFGRRPSADTGSEWADAFVWVKPGGESDGTSDSSADRYDEFCGKPDAFQPSPEAGQWHQAYFEMLIENANPAI
ncbi:Exoglucanase-like protein [Hapsidospora chrysogenum ATCC 11550]|uniref:Glucanase n=1 Tax=Hapsidospora chrysogenum (strain ATCC 11550 / CBS 779.69 / DSM 880 / IAM 14645 / JCM 23072 / IMI 49137) TaxID=857340 RepID=A0A086TBR5_HAPC1|nr:Exoglucanase-like protein [Hapsidospora chrysogenum ATCC 11550]